MQLCMAIHAVGTCARGLNAKHMSAVIVGQKAVIQELRDNERHWTHQCWILKASSGRKYETRDKSRNQESQILETKWTFQACDLSHGKTKGLPPVCYHSGKSTEPPHEIGSSHELIGHSFYEALRNYIRPSQRAMKPKCEIMTQFLKECLQQPNLISWEQSLNQWAVIQAQVCNLTILASKSPSCNRTMEVLSHWQVIAQERFQPILLKVTLGIFQLVCETAAGITLTLERSNYHPTPDKKLTVVSPGIQFKKQMPKKDFSFSQPGLTA